MTKCLRRPCFRAVRDESAELQFPSGIDAPPGIREGRRRSRSDAGSAFITAVTLARLSACSLVIVSTSRKRLWLRTLITLLLVTLAMPVGLIVRARFFPPHFDVAS